MRKIHYCSWNKPDLSACFGKQYQCRANDHQVFHDVLPHQCKGVRKVGKRNIHKEKERYESADHMQHQRIKREALPDAQDQYQAKAGFPDGQKNNGNMTGYQTERNQVDGVFGQLISRAQVWKIFQRTEPKVNNADANAKQCKRITD